MDSSLKDSDQLMEVYNNIIWNTQHLRWIICYHDRSLWNL